MAAQISLLRRGPRPSGAALAGGRSLAYSGGRFSALGTVPFSGGGLQQVVYAALVNAGATPEFARQVANSGNARALSVISRLSEGQIYQILGRNLSAPQLISALTQPTGGILHDIVGGLEEFFGTVLDIGGVLTAGATIPAGLTLNAEGARELAQGSDRPRSQRASVSPPRPGFASYLAEGIEALPSAIRGGVNLANKIGSYFEPGPGPDGQPMAGRTSQGVPILDQTTDCPTCGGPPPSPQQAFSASPSEPLTLQPGGSEGPTLLPPPPQPGTAPELPPPDDMGDVVTAYPYNFNRQGGQNELQPANQPGYDQPDYPLTNQPGGQSIPQQIRQLRDQLNNEIQIEQQQLTDQRAKGQQLNNIRDQINDLKNLEKVPPDQRDIPSELARKHQLMNQLDQLERGQPVMQIPNQPATAPELRGPGPQRGIEPAPQLAEHGHNGPGPRQGGQEPAQPIQFCVGCQSQEDAILFLNGEQAACSVIPGSTQPIQGV